MNWYYAEGTQQIGPVNEEEFQNLVQTGKILPGTLVWREGMPNWQPYQQIVQGAPAVPMAPSPVAGTVVCQECGQAFPAEQTVRYGTVTVCANCKPLFLQKLREGAPLAGQMDYAGFWVRFVAKLLDGLILGIPLIGIYLLVLIPAIRNQQQPDLALQAGFQLGFYLVALAYNTFFVGKYGATPGKMALKLRVVTAEGGTVTYGRAAGRYLGEILSSLICNIGYIIAAFDNPQKRALHDHICNTRVIRS